MSELWTFGAGFYCGAGFLTLLFVQGGAVNRIVSALFWPTFPLWPWWRH